MDADVDLFTFQGHPLRFPPEKVIGSFLAAAVGDAIGWPFEDRSGWIGRQRAAGIPEDFFPWTRRAGTRYLAYEEPINAGTYSDDTQLLLATARSLLTGVGWWDHFTQVELPIWPLYERGGGAATKRAVNCWLRGLPPWKVSDNVNSYYAAGGNGVCMRILPHAIAHGQTSDFKLLATDIARNGIATHGHPRALIGALLHGFVLYTAFRQRETLDYGALISIALDKVGDWANMPEFPDIWKASEGARWDRYPEIWREIVWEVTDLLEIAKRDIGRGPLTTGGETLEKLGAFDRRISGAGTVTAVASTFVASRFAASPLQGLLAAATAHGADTDTISSMVGSILGAVSGEEWLTHFSSRVQDATYITKLASRLNSSIPASDGAGSAAQKYRPVTKAETRAFIAQISKGISSDRVTLPDGRAAEVTERLKLTARTRNSDVRLWRLNVEDGQTLAITVASKECQDRRVINTGRSRLGLLRSGVKLFVRDLSKARSFYVDQLGLSIGNESSAGFTVNGTISVHRDHAPDGEIKHVEGRMAANVCFKVKDVNAAYEYLRDCGADLIGPVSRRGGCAFFYVRDPDGNVLEIFEVQTRTQ
jgi:ADP-ribosylglycohydrolase/catechol 2,3-dioxygenase-like lactoylglutathione lyase family enzyme